MRGPLQDGYLNLPGRGDRLRGFPGGCQSGLDSYL